MTKIEEFENKLIANGMCSEDFTELEKLLRRVHDNFLKLQHCYITAQRFPKANYKQAIDLVVFGMETYPPDSWFSKYSCYLSMGTIYQKAEVFQEAYEAYRKAENILETSLDPRNFASYQQSLALDLFWVKLHMDDFQYSPELEKYYNIALEDSKFARAFLGHRFRSAVAEIIICLHYAQKDKAKAAYKRAIELCAPGYKGDLYELLKKHRYTESLKVTDQCAAYLNRLSHEMKT